MLLCGDQQTYNIMQTLKKDHPAKYNWVYLYPGDWHLLKLCSELLHDQLWDGGFKQMCAACRHKKEVTQWQDLNNMWLAVYECLMRKAVEKYSVRHTSDGCGGLAFWSWVESVSTAVNSDEVSRFWARFLFVLNGYVGLYFSIRSGNWFLRNSCLKLLSPLFFAYSRNKYEELSTIHIFATLTYPQSILDRLATGEWTVSIRKVPYHNVALDECHECVINRRLKQITCRPSHFRTVQLADFMAYLDRALCGFDNFFRLIKSFAQSTYVCEAICV